MGGPGAPDIPLQHDFQEHPRALFVVGAPRSGTTLLGNYLASAPDVLNLGEYGGFHLAHNVARSTLGTTRGPFRDAYLVALAQHARLFAQGLASERGRPWFCDVTPWNIEIADQFGPELDGSLYLLTLRHYAGTVQSLRRAYAEGATWAGATWAESAAIWARCYTAVSKLPPDRTVAVSYEALTSEPGQTLALLRAGLEEHGFDCSGLDARQLAKNLASPSRRGGGPTIGSVVSNQVVLRPIPSFDQARWSGDIHATVWPVVKDVHHMLMRRFQGVYRTPPPPQDLSVHDDIDGLVPADLGDNW